MKINTDKKKLQFELVFGLFVLLGICFSYFQLNLYIELSQIIPNDKIVLLDYKPKDYTFDLLNLPIKNINNNQIRYIVQFFNVNKTKYNYILKRPNIDTLNNKIIANEYYVLIKNE